MAIENVFRYIDETIDETVRDFQEYLRIPSVSARGEALDEGAEFTKKLMEKAGIPTIQLLEAGGPKVVVAADMAHEGKKTLLCYGHYDVQPEDPVDQWVSPPFAAEIKDGRIIARGATDNKGGVLAFIKAYEAFQKVEGKVPLNLKFLFEGEEEIGSPHLDDFCLKYGNLLEADGMHCLDGGVNPSRLSPEIELGLKGILYVELIKKGPKKDVYSGSAAMVENPVWRLIHALSTLVDEKGNILIDGWYDDYVPPTKTDLDLIRREVEAVNEKDILDHFGVDHFAYGKSLFDVLSERHYGGTATINGIVGGYTGEGAKTIVPSQALVKIDFRLPPDMNDQKQLEKLKAHLAKRGFDDIEIRCLSGRGYPYKIPVTEALAQVIIDASTEIFGAAPAIYGLTQEDIIRHHLGLPVVLTGFGPPDCNLHAPNENMTIDYLKKGIKYAALIMEKYGRLDK